MCKHSKELMNICILSSIHFAYVVLFLESHDSKAPKLTCFTYQSRATDEGKRTTMVIWEDPPASDNSGIVTVTCNLQSGIILTLGHTPVTCEAVDDSGNKAICSFPVYVGGN